MAKTFLDSVRQNYVAPPLPTGSNVTSQRSGAQRLTANLDDVITLFNRGMASLSEDPQGKVDILVQRGVPREAIQILNGELFVNTPNGLQKFDEDSISIYDFADEIGPLLPAAGSVLGAYGGLPGAFAGGAVGDIGRQALASAAGSEQGYSPTQTLTEGVMSLGGEVASRGLQALLKGPGAKLAQEGGMKQVREMARATDQKLGTDLLGKAPVDVRTASPFMGAMAQSRRMAFETQEPMRKADEPFLREMEKSFDQFIDRAGAAPPAPKDGQIYAVGLGERAAEAIEGTTRERLAKRSQLYADFEKVIDPTTPVQRTEIDAALNSIENTNVFNREGTVGTKGLNKLVEAMDNARSAQTFADVSRISEQLYDEIDAATGSATPLFAPGVLSQMRTLASALHKTEMDFLRSGGGTNSPQAYDLGRRAADYAKDLFALNESSGMRKILRDPELRSQIPKSLFDNLSAEQIIAFKRSIGQEGTSGGLQVNEQGQKVFAEMLGDFFSRLRQQASVSTDQRRQGMFPQDLQKSISGKQINDTLDRIEKSRPGAVEALLGKRVEGELRQLANTLQQLTQSERSVGNYSNTARYNMLEGGLSSDLLDALTGVFKQGSGTRDALARIAARALRDVVLKEMTTRPGVGRYFLGETALQQAIPNNLLRAIGRTGGQVGIRQLGDN